MLKGDGVNAASELGGGEVEQLALSVRGAAEPGGDLLDAVLLLELGEVRVRIEGQPNAAALAQVLDRVLR